MLGFSKMHTGRHMVVDDDQVSPSHGGADNLRTNFLRKQLSKKKENENEDYIIVETENPFRPYAFITKIL